MAISPNVKVNTRANFSLGGADLYGTAAMIGLASWGQDTNVKEFSTFTEVKSHYKSGQVVDAAEKFFLGGGRNLKVLRLVGSDKSKSTITLQASAVDQITLNAKYHGSYGNNISVTVTTNGSNRDVVITDGTTTETYENIASNTLIVDAINASSVLVDAVLVNSTLIDNLTKTFLTTGDDGDTVITSDYTTALQGPLITLDWDYLFIPEQTNDAFHTSIAAILDNRADVENKYSVFVTGVDKFEAIDTTVARTATNSNGRLVVVHSAYFDGSSTTELYDTTKWLDASYTAAMYAGKLCSLPVNSSPTFKTMPMIPGKLLTSQEYTNADKEKLTAAGFTTITKTLTGTYGVWMGVTRRGTTTDWDFMLDNVRKVDYIKDNVYNSTIKFIGLPNDTVTRQSIKAELISFMIDLTRDRIVESYEIEVIKGTDPRAVIINTSVLLINELDYIEFNLTLNV